MSGVAGIVHLDGAPVEGSPDADLLRRMTDSLAFRGPDSQRIWTSGPVGFGHALLRVTNDTDHEEQPASLDGAALEKNAWIVADARVDGRPELIRKLSAAGRHIASRTPDHALILHAYRVWGSACVDHLIGDFAFAIWDGAERRLFCARDHFGVKPFFYSLVGRSFIFSNTLNCLRLYPAISNRLNDLAIADFLLFDMNQDPATTSFADLQRLAPAHVLTVENGNVSTHRYWTLPAAEPIHERGQECVEHFKELMDSAVADRLRTDSAGILMSGGLDSSTVALHAQRVFRTQGKTDGLHAYTEVFDRLFPHDERHYAGLAAEALQIPIHYRSADRMKLYDVFDEPKFNWPEPVQCPWGASSTDQLREIATRSRIAFTGYGADPALSSQISVHFHRLFEKGQFGAALADALRYLTAEGRPSRLYIRTRWRIFFRPERRRPWFPPWLNRDVEKKFALRDRWNALAFTRRKTEVQGVRPTSYETLTHPLWMNLFEWQDPGVTRVGVEARHPFFDLRLLSFLLALPALPWCSDKELLRRAARGVLPDKMRLRRKSPLQADPLLVLLQRPESAWVDHFETVPEMERYVVRSRIPPVLSENDVWTAWIHLRPLSLNFWLRRAQLPGYKFIGNDGGYP